MRKTIYMIFLMLLILVTPNIVTARPPPLLQPGIIIPDPPQPNPQPTTHTSSRGSIYKYSGTFETCVYDNTYLHIFNDLTPFIKNMNINETITLKITLNTGRRTKPYYLVKITKMDYGKCESGLKLY